MSVLLTDEELRDCYDLRKINSYIEADRAIAKAQAQRIVEWLESECKEHRKPFTLERRLCADCWQALKEEVRL